MQTLTWALSVLLVLTGLIPRSRADERRLLYVAVPGIRNYLEYGGHGLLVFDRDDGYRFVKRIPTGGRAADGSPLNVKGICASATTQLVHISTTQTLECLDLASEQLLWERAYDKGCDRMALSPDGTVIYLPSLEQDVWYVVDARTGAERKRLVLNSRAHNTVYGLDGSRCYLAGLGSEWLAVADTTTHTVRHQVGPFSHSIRPFTVNGRQTRAYVCINECLGFEVGDIESGKKLFRVEVPGVKGGPVKRHGCPSHGIGLTPDERQLWVCDAFNRLLHVFDATVEPPAYVDRIACRDEPGWIAFSMDGERAYPSSGEVIDVATRRVLTTLTDERGRMVASEKLLEIDWDGQTPIRAGNQFGVGQVTN